MDMCPNLSKAQLPVFVLVDFERAMINALNRIFQKVVIVGCLKKAILSWVKKNAKYSFRQYMDEDENNYQLSDI